jgi:hypothetical protein
LPSHLARPQHGAGGAQSANFVQLVADVQNAAALGRQTPQHHKQFFDGLWRQDRSGFIQNQNFGLAQQGADDFHALHFTHTQTVHGTQGVNVQTVIGGLLRDALGDFGQTQMTVQAQPDILGHAQGIEQAEVLKHHADASRTGLLGVADRGGHPVDQDFTRIGLDRPINDLHQGGFARPVLAQDGMNFTRQHPQRHLVVGHHRRIAFGDALQFQACGGLVRFCHFDPPASGRGAA